MGWVEWRVRRERDAVLQEPLWPDALAHGPGHTRLTLPDASLYQLNYAASRRNAHHIQRDVNIQVTQLTLLINQLHKCLIQPAK